MWLHAAAGIQASPREAVRSQKWVDAVDDPAEEAAVQCLAHGVPHLGGFLHRVGPDDGLSPGHDAVRG